MDWRFFLLLMIITQKNVDSIATQELANHTFRNFYLLLKRFNEFYQPILIVQLISMDYPSKFNNYHYAFYLGSQMMTILPCF